MKNTTQRLLLGFSVLLITACGDRAISSDILSSNPTSEIPVEVPTIENIPQTNKSVDNINTIALINLQNGYAIEGYNYNNTTINLSFCRDIITYGPFLEKFSIIDDVMKSPSVVIETAEGVLNINSNYELGIYNDITITAMSAIEC